MTPGPASAAAAGLQDQGVDPGELTAALGDIAARTSGAAAPARSLTSAHPGEIASLVGAMFGRVAAGSDPATRSVEAELKSVVLDIIGAPRSTPCALTSSGAESILLAVLAAKRAAKPGPQQANPQLLTGRNVHPSVLRAAEILEIEVVRLPLTADQALDVAAVRGAISARTLMIVAAAPAWATGVHDPAQALGRLAQSAGVACHLDACLGGALQPFLDAVCGTAHWQGFSAPGISSISVDLHKYGYAPFGLSCLSFRNDGLASQSRFECRDWDGFAFETASLSGSRPFGPVAGAWAVARSLGRSGYLRLAGEVVSVRSELVAMLAQHGATLAGPAQSAIIAARPADGDIARLSAALRGAGISAIACFGPQLVRIRIDPLLGTAFYREAIAQAGRVLSAEPSHA